MRNLILSFGIILVFTISSCSSEPKESGPIQKTSHESTTKESGTKTTPKKNSKTSSALKEKHKHADRAEQTACPICNIRLLMTNGYKEITIEDLKKMQKNNEPFILINTLEFYNYRVQHILNSISIPEQEIQDTAPKLFKTDTKIVVYCQSYHCSISTKAAEKLVGLGYTHVLDYKGGIKEWEEKGNLLSGLRHLPHPPKKGSPKKIIFKK